jgi:hypothetical protein
MTKNEYFHAYMKNEDFEFFLRPQENYCETKGVKGEFVSSDMIVGIAESIREGEMPINGLRHPVVGDTSGWYLWGGEEEVPQDNPSFFTPVHASHLLKHAPVCIKYLGLPPGWRFQIDNNDYEDTWRDEGLPNTA